MNPEPHCITVGELAKLLFAQITAGNGNHSVRATMDGKGYDIANVANDPGQLSLVFKVANREHDDIDIWGSKRLHWMFPRVGQNNEGMDVLRVDLRRTLGVEPILVAFDGNRRGWSILTIVKPSETAEFVAQEVFFLSVAGGKLDHAPAVGPALS